MKVFVFIALAFSLFLGSCSNEPSLQKFFVENAEKKDFIALDISSSILNIDEAKLSVEQKAALTSFDKMNIIVFKSTPKNQATYEAEKLKINGILKDEFYLDQTFASVEEAKRATKNAIKLYNSKRLHLSLGYKTPNIVYKLSA